MFSAGSTNTALAIAEIMKGLNYTCTLINVRNSQKWWDDGVAIKKLFTVVSLSDLSGSEQMFDIIFEVGDLLLSTTSRKTLTSKSIWIVRKPFVLGETELCIYPMSVSERSTEGITETWLLKDVTSPDDISALEVLTRKPVRHLPFLWTPLPAEGHHRAIGAPVWKGVPTEKLFVHMVDTNTTCSSSSVLPLVILREANRSGLPIQTWKMHNGEQLSKSKFFRENILKHCSDLDLSGECVGRQRCPEWATFPNHVAMAHLRFRDLRPVLLDLTWVGIPVVHNSTVLRDIGFGLDSLYFSDNSVSEGVAAISKLHKLLPSWADTLKDRREHILRRWSPISPAIRDTWTFYIQKLAPVHVAVPVPIVETQMHSAPKSNTYTVLFCDMWDQFQEDYNFFTLMLNEAGSKLNPPKIVKGVSLTNLVGKPDLVFFGPFGVSWMKYPGVPKVHYTGENTPPVPHADVKLNLGFRHVDMAKEDYLRFPIWFTEINWFSADVERLVNPKPIPLELCTRTQEDTWSSRSKFCSFIVTNPMNPIRNQSFHWLNTYKTVDSAGNLYNTVGNELSALRGGGGGEIKKTQFMMNYTFALTYENNTSSGYTTEKYLHAKAAGTVPIYWGDPNFQRDFNPAGCIDARGVKTPDELIKLVKECDTEAEWKKRAAIPALDDYAVELTRRTMAEASRRIFAALGVDTSDFPRAIGATKGSPEAHKGMDDFARHPTIIQETPLQTPLLVTYVTFKFLGSLQHWLTAAKNQLRALPDMKAHVFVGPDVPEVSISTLKETYTFATFECVPADWTPPNFTDFWEPTHFAWKIWIYNTLVQRESLKGKLILYIDAGAVLVRWPQAWLRIAQREGISCLEDPREENERWCGDSFCERLSVTDEERSSKQIVAGIMSFVAGHPVATAFFADAFVYAQERDTIVGPRLSGVSVDGKSYGHRQDQSILSILVRRHPIPLEPLDTVYCDHSMRQTFMSGKAVYVHRGDFKKTVPFLPGIEDAFVINLDRRADRLEGFWKTHPELVGRVNRTAAYDGKLLTLTPELATLFKPNDFFWKKAVMGCAMSHLSLWWKLVNEHPDIHNYLIFEDDAKLKDGWEEILEKSMAHIPEDYDVLYLGGILPPNRDAFETVLEPVTKYYSRVKPNSIFGQNPPTNYFHSCAYAYILSRNGAMKILKGMEIKKGYWTSADHMMCTPSSLMNLYFLTPAIAGCFQDSDPAYANSQFNNFSRVDSFDSDLWNNDERFPVPQSTSDTFDLAATLRSVFTPHPTSAPKLPVTTPPVTTLSLTPEPYTGHSVILNSGRGIPIRFIKLKELDLEFNKLCECDWLFALFGIKTVALESFTADTEPPSDCPIVILQRPYVFQTTEILRKWSAAGAVFKILHLSDESTIREGRDPLFAYTLKGCKSVLRFYIRDDFPPGTESKIQIIPLGFRWSRLRLSQSPLDRTPHVPFRELHWSFHGTNWQERKTQMKPLLDCSLINSCKFYDTWNDPANLTQHAYQNVLANSIFVPCPDGMNPETFRVYEALEAGCIPLIVHSEQNDMWFRWISNNIPLLDNKSWEDAVKNMFRLLTKPETLEIYRTQLITNWVVWTTTLKTQSAEWLLS